MIVLAVIVILWNPLNGLTEESNSPEGIISRIDSNNIAITARAQEISAGCDTKECSVYKIYRHIQSSNATSREKSIRFASYLTNINIPVQIAFPDNSDNLFVLVGGIDRQHLYQIFIDDTPPFHTEHGRFAASQIWTKIPFEDNAADLVVRVDATAPVNLYAVRSAYEIYTDTKRLEGCSVRNLLSFTEVCSLPAGGALAVQSLDNASITISLATADLLEQDIPLMLYKGQNYIPFDFESNIWQKGAKLANVKILGVK